MTFGVLYEILYTMIAYMCGCVFLVRAILCACMCPAIRQHGPGEEGRAGVGGEDGSEGGWVEGGVA